MAEKSRKEGLDDNAKLAELAFRLSRMREKKGAAFSIRDTFGIMNDIEADARAGETIPLQFEFHHVIEDFRYKSPAQRFHEKDTFSNIVQIVSTGRQLLRFMGRDQLIFWWDNMNLEPHATPMGVGMVGGELIHVYPREMAECIDGSLIEQMPVSLRIGSDIDFGLNFLMGDPLPIIYKADLLSHNDHPSPESALACKEQLKCIENVLFPAFDLTIRTFETRLPEHLPDFSKIQSKLRLNVYQHAVECMQEVYELMARYENSAIIVSKSQSFEEGQRRLELKKDLGRTLQEFQQAIQSYQAELLGM